VREHICHAVERNGVHSESVYGDGQHRKPDRGINSMLVIQVMFRLFTLKSPSIIPSLHSNILRPGHNPLLIVHLEPAAVNRVNNVILLLIEQERLRRHIADQLLLRTHKPVPECELPVQERRRN